ncbi:hypothetical protein HK405_001517, partial [Cladochytrium tenue]
MLDYSLRFLARLFGTALRPVAAAALLPHAAVRRALLGLVDHVATLNRDANYAYPHSHAHAHTVGASHSRRPSVLDMHDLRDLEADAGYSPPQVPPRRLPSISAAAPATVAAAADAVRAVFAALRAASTATSTASGVTPPARLLALFFAVSPADAAATSAAAVVRLPLLQLMAEWAGMPAPAGTSARAAFEEVLAVAVASGGEAGHADDGGGV